MASCVGIHQPVSSEAGSAARFAGSLEISSGKEHKLYLGQRDHYKGLLFPAGFLLQTCIPSGVTCHGTGGREVESPGPDQPQEL
jgi:hypothetical protein